MPTLIFVAVVSGWNLQGWPGRVNDDEGIYVAEAWAMLVPHHISNYTYWYDHPFLGWAQLAGYIWLTDGFHRYSSAVMVGREFMWVINLVSCAILYVVARRLRFRRTTATAAVLLFGLSPLAVYFHRMVFLDNIAVLWMLAALALAASPKRSIGSAVGSGVCFAVAVLSKETIAVLLPAVAWTVWQHTSPRTRAWNLGGFWASFVLLVLGYPVFAALRGELFPGKGHVSLLYSLYWQLAGRTGSGTVFNGHSGTHGLFLLWTGLDRWLLFGGVALLPFAFIARRLRPTALALGVQVVMLLRGGYIPYMYVTAMLPFCSLVISGLADTCWKSGSFGRRGRHMVRLSRLSSTLVVSGRLAVLAFAAVFALFAIPSWFHTLTDQSKINGDSAELAATLWVEHRLPAGSVVVLDDYMWTDVKMHGKADPLSIWKVNGDPWVTKHVLPHGYKSIDYIVLIPQTSTTLSTLPTLATAWKHSVVIKDFGDGLTARKVIKN